MCILLKFLKLNKISRIKHIVIIHLEICSPISCYSTSPLSQPQLREKKLLGPLLRTFLLEDCLQGS